MHTIREYNYTIIKPTRNGNSKTKKNQSVEVIKHNQWDGCTWWFLHRSSIRRL